MSIYLNSTSKSKSRWLISMQVMSSHHSHTPAERLCCLGDSTSWSERPQRAKHNLKYVCAKQELELTKTQTHPEAQLHQPLYWSMWGQLHLHWLSAAFEWILTPTMFFCKSLCMQVVLLEASCSWFWTVSPSYTTWDTDGIHRANANHGLQTRSISIIGELGNVNPGLHPKSTKPLMTKAWSYGPGLCQQEYSHLRHAVQCNKPVPHKL